MRSASPRRPLPTRVYWFRRVMVLGVALGLVFGVAQLLGRTVGDDPDQARTVSSTPGESGSSSPSPAAPTPTTEAAPESPAASGKPKRSKKGKKEPLPEPTGPCRAEEIVATPTVAGEAYAGRTVRFVLELTTQDTPACTWTASPTSLVVKLTSGSDRIWSSQDCPASVQGGPVVVRQEVPAKVTVAWRGQRSDEACSRTTPWALPGWYHVAAAAYGAEPTDLQFELERPLPATITAEPKTKERPAGDGEADEQRPKNKKKKQRQANGR